MAPDYRTFPQGTIGDMVTDTANAVQWTRHHIDEYGENTDGFLAVAKNGNPK